MSFEACIDDKIAKGDAETKKAGEKLKRQYESFREYHRKSHDQTTADAMAARDTLGKAQEELDYDTFIKQKAALDYEKFLKTVKQKYNGDTSKAVRGLSEQSFNRAEGIMREVFAGLTEYVEANRPKLAGLTRNLDNARLVMRELLGQSTGDKLAKEYADVLRTTMNNLNQRFRNAGGYLNDIENYYPQSHSRFLMRKVSRDDWKAYITPLLDERKIIDFDTNLPVTPEKLNEILDGVYETVVDGVTPEMKRIADEGGQIPPFGGDVNLRHRYARVLHFKDADAAIDYNSKFGANNDSVYDMMIGHLETMARDIALLETFGVKPNQLMRKAEQRMRVENKTRGITTIHSINTYKIAAGMHMNEVDDHWGFRWLGHTQSLLRAAYLGGAVISSITDLPMMYITARHHGLRPAKVIANHFKGINPASQQHRRNAKRLGYMADIANGSAIGQSRYDTDSWGAGLPQALSNFTIVASGLRAWTNSVKDAVAMEFEGLLAEHAIRNTSFGNLPENLRATLEEGGITANDWMIMKRAPLFEPEEGVTFLNAMALEQLQSSDPVYVLELGAKLSTITSQMRRMAANEPTVNVMALTTGGAAAKGTMTRAAASSFLMLKTFPLTMMLRQLYPLFAKNPSNRLRIARAEHAAALFVATTLLGGLAIQAKEASKGKTPKDMNNPQFWLAASLQGGGLGIFGDFLFTDYSRFGQSPLETMAGPIAALPFDAMRALKGNLDRAITDGDGEYLRNTGRDVYKFIADKIPAQNLWYSRLVFERTVKDQIEKLIDPDFNQRVRRMEKRALKDAGQSYIWSKGDLLPNQ